MIWKILEFLFPERCEWCECLRSDPPRMCDTGYMISAFHSWGTGGPPAEREYQSALEFVMSDED